MKRKIHTSTTSVFSNEERAAGALEVTLAVEATEESGVLKVAAVVIGVPLDTIVNQSKVR